MAKGSHGPRLRVLCAAAMVAATASSEAPALPQGLEAALQEAAQQASAKYNCSVSIAFRSEGGNIAVAAGVTDFASGTRALPSDSYAWGSITKMYTAASIMRLVSEGAFGLNDEIAPLVDPFLARMAKRNPAQNFTSLADLWGERVRETTVRQALSMKTGIPDFDTATPRRNGSNVDPLRAELYARPNRTFSPTQLMEAPWVSGKFKPCSSPFMCYSSTNFVILGFLLAAHAGVDSWESFDQGSFLPSSLRGRLHFATMGAPKDFKAAHGYDRTTYNRQGGRSDHDNWAVDGVFAGWTASDIVAPASAVADLAWEIYGPPSSVAPEAQVKQMLPSKLQFYGLGTMNVGWFTGRESPWRAIRGHAVPGYGHLGATYGYQSIVGYFAKVNFSLAIATNIETDNQVQPSDALCSAFNSAADLLQGTKSNCRFVAGGGFSGGRCTCSDTDSVFV